jgi:hypothetical protein
LTGVIIINKKYNMEPAIVIELGVSDDLAQVLSVLHTNYATENRILKRHFGDIKEFRYLLQKETWQEVFSETEGKCEIPAFYERSSISF